jgi:hypothetical protein
VRYVRHTKVPVRRTHYSSGRVASLLLNLNTDRRSRNVTLTRSSDGALEPVNCVDWRCGFAPCCDGRRPNGSRPGCTRPFSSDCQFLAQFARVLRRDLDAVNQAITSRWSNGPVEGQINRLK